MTECTDAKPLVAEDIFGDNRWIDLHEIYICETKDKEPDVLFIGDDHIALLEQTEIFKELFAPLHCLCFGSLGDRTSQLIWRIENGELEDISPKVIVVSIGGFNYGSTASDILMGIKRIAQIFAEKQPNSKVFFLKLLTAGRKNSPWRDTLRSVSDGMEEVFKQFPNIAAIDSDPSLVASDGIIDHHDMFDFAHLTQEGYRKVFENSVHVAVTGALNPNS